MSLLLDALKKAALEKQRQAQTPGAAASAPEGVSKPPKKAHPGPTLLPNWAQKKHTTLVLDEGFEVPLADRLLGAGSVAVAPMDQALSFEGPDAAPFETTASFEDDSFQPEVEFLDESDQGLHDEAAEAALSCEFIDISDLDISDLDFATLVGFEETRPATAVPVAQPVTAVAPLVLSLVQVDEGENTAPEASAGETAELNHAPLEAASLAPEIAPVSPSQPLDEKTGTAAPIGSPAVKPDSTERTGNNPVHFTHQAAKQALNELLHNSQQAANRSRKRLLRMYGVLVVIATGLVGVYYYLLHLDTTSVLALPLQSGLQQAATADIQTAEAQAVTAPTADEVATAEASEMAVAPGTFSATVEASAQVQSAANSPQPASTNTKKIVPVALTDAPALDDPSASAAPASPADAASDHFNGEVMEPVDVPIRGAVDAPMQAEAPIRTPATTVLAYQPAAQDDVSSAVEQGYAAYEAGDFTTAAQAYRAALLLDPYQRDALLGAASVALQQGRPNDALSFYQQRLARAPKDDFALAGLLAMSNQVASNPLLDAELGRLIIAYPQAAHLHYLQGTLYAQRQQWGAAQLALLTAWQLDNHNPDIACNLAIAFDHLQQPEEAARFYRQALNLANGQTVSFALPAIRTRLAQLEGAGVNDVKGAKDIKDKKDRKERPHR